MSLDDQEPEEPVSLAESLEGVVRSLRGPSRQAVGGLFGRWDEAVGEQVAEQRIGRDALKVVGG